MNKLLQKAFEKAAELPEEKQIGSRRFCLTR